MTCITCDWELRPYDRALGICPNCFTPIGVVEPDRPVEPDTPAGVVAAIADTIVPDWADRADETADAPVRPVATRGRPVGSVEPGGLSAWFAAADVGDVYWTEREMNGLASIAKRAGKRITVKRFYAVSDDLVAVRLTRIEVIV